MTAEEAKKMFDEYKAQGKTEDQLVSGLYAMFTEDKIDVEEFESLLNVLGYELDEKFKSMSPEDQKTKGWEEGSEEKPSQAEIEDAKEFDPNEDKSENKSENNSDTEEESDDDKAAKLFGFGKK